MNGNFDTDKEMKVYVYVIKLPFFVTVELEATLTLIWKLSETLYECIFLFKASSLKQLLYLFNL